MTEEQAGVIIATWVVVAMIGIGCFVGVANYAKAAKRRDEWDRLTHQEHDTPEDKARRS